MSITKSSYTKISALIMFILIQSLSDIYVMIAIIVLMEIVIDFIFGGSKITADGDCSHEIKRHLLLGRKAMTNLGSILKSRDTTLSTKVRLVKAMVFPVVMYGYESWTIKKLSAEELMPFNCGIGEDS